MKKYIRVVVAVELVTVGAKIEPIVSCTEPKISCNEWREWK